MSIHYHRSADGIHVVTTTDDQPFNTDIVLEQFKEIHHQAYSKKAYVMLNFGANYSLPLREFVIDLKQFYNTADTHNLRVAIVVQASLLRVMEAVIKTLVTREHIQYFTDTDRAMLWLQLERGKNAA